MAENLYVNKLVVGNEVKFDLTSDTVTAEKLLSGYTAHDQSGAPIIGTYTGEGGTSQAKTVTPTLSVQTVLPDAGVDFLSQVTVNAIPVVETDNAAGGKTVMIG